MKEMIYSPLDGERVRLEDVSDPMFAQKMLGDGIAIIPSSGKVVAPIAGEVIMLFETHHAIGIRSEKGVEMLIHIGIDTVTLEGKPFEVFVEVGEHVSVGTQLINVNLDLIQSAGCDTITPIICTNYKLDWVGETEIVQCGDEIFQVTIE